MKYELLEEQVSNDLQNSVTKILPRYRGKAFVDAGNVGNLFFESLKYLVDHFDCNFREITDVSYGTTFEFKTIIKTPDYDAKIKFYDIEFGSLFYWFQFKTYISFSYKI